MSRIISRAESFEKVYQAFSTINFNAFDYNTIKQSLLDYLQLYHKEDFNDLIESSEFLAIIETFAYIAELLAYRIDVNAHENFLTTAQRKESVLRLAKFISYKASRNIPMRGLVKMTSVQTSESIFDSAGRNLANRRIFWNDPNNPDWKEQFLLVMGRVLKQPFGSVSPSERIQIDDVLLELYELNNNALSTSGLSVIKFSASNSGQTFPLEIVPVTLDSEVGPIEKRPELNLPMSLLYSSDGLGDASDTTGFLFYIKQGVLNRTVSIFDGITPNQTFEIAINNINDTDIWVNNIDPDTSKVIVDDPNQTIIRQSSDELRYGEWTEVDITNAQNIIFNTNTQRRKYEVETLNNDQVRIIFGDGEFSDIPNGTFELYYRVSANSDLILPKSSVINQASRFSYTDSVGSVQTLTFTFSLVNSLLNASVSEDIEHIRRIAPAVYYTQDRMVNAKDYNTFMLQDPSILKMMAFNRTFVGHSKYLYWNDASENYENVKIFGDDLALYYKDEDPDTGGLVIVDSPLDANELVNNIIEPLLSSTDIFLVLGSLLEANGLSATSMRRVFNNNILDCNAVGELDAITTALDPLSFPIQIDLYYSVPTTNGNTGEDEWTVGPNTCSGISSLWMFRINAKFVGNELKGWEVRYRLNRLIAHSPTTKFWNTNDTTRIIDYDTLDSNLDNLVILQANIASDRKNLLDRQLTFNILGQELVEQNLSNAGLPDIHRLSIITNDDNGDGVSDNLDISELFNVELTSSQTTICSDPDFVFDALPSSGYQRVSRSGVESQYSLTGLNDAILGISACSPGFFVISGNKISKYQTGLTINVANSFGNNGNYTIVSSTYDSLSNQTSIEVVEPVPSSIPDGNLSLTYSATINVDGTPQVVNILGNAGDTFIHLIEALNLSLTGATAYFNENDITIRSTTLGGTSSISITDGASPQNLFGSLIDFLLFATAVSGSNSNSYILTLPNGMEYITGRESSDIQVWVQGNPLIFGIDWFVPTEEDLINVGLFSIADQEASSVIKRRIKFAETLFTSDGLIADIVFNPSAPHIVKVKTTDYVYFTRGSNQEEWIPVNVPSDSIKSLWALEDHTQARDTWLYDRRKGRMGLNFAWLHRSNEYHLIDPSPTNIIDAFIITKGYYLSLKRWIENRTSVQPETPTSLDLRLSYSKYIDNKMISDSLILHPGKLKILFGSKAEPALQATFKVIRPINSYLTDNEVKVKIVSTITNFFNIDLWEFGETFYLTELTSAIHRDLGTEIDSIVLVPLYSGTQFGDLFVIPAREDEMFIPDIGVEDIEIVSGYTPDILRQEE